MREMRFYVESARHKAITYALGFIGMIPGILLIFTGILKAMGENNKFVRICVKLCIPAGIIAAVFIGLAIYVYFKNRRVFTISSLPQGGMQMIIRDPEGNEHGATGHWTCHALFTKHYHKYGTYRKQLYLILFCNDKMFCMLRHEVAPIDHPPIGFNEIDDEAEVNVPVYHTKKTPEIYRLVMQNLPKT